MNKVDKEKLHEIYELVMNGVVSSWPQLEIQGMLRGMEIDDDTFVEMMRYLLLDRFYDLYYRSLNEGDDCLRFLENPKVMDYILMNEGNRVVCERSANALFPEEFKFSCVEFLGNVEIHHPVLFLKYFLKNDSSALMENTRTGYFALLRMVMKRTKVRAKRIKEYERFIPRLEERYGDYCNMEMFLN